MAIDTENERMAMVSMARPFAPTLPLPSGAIDTAAERLQLAYAFGNEAAAPIPPPVEDFVPYCTLTPISGLAGGGFTGAF